MRTTLSLIALAAALGACASTPDGGFGGAFATADGEAGLVKVEVRTDTAPQRGRVLAHLTVLDAKSRAPIDGANVVVVPFMPAMGHGSHTPMVTAKGNGVYDVDAELYMPGRWELRTTVSGPMSDRAVPSIDVK